MDPQFGEYQLLRLLGEGGMAQVWEAQRRTVRGALRCAVKLIKAEHVGDPNLRTMFVREGQLSLILSGHDNVVSVFDIGEFQGRPYMAMELIDGMPLSALARRVGERWPVAAAVAVAADLLRALSHVHDLGAEQTIVHRDVTPHNVMIGRDGQVKLMDFGIAQRAEAEPSLAQALGKLSYVPREQVEGDVDARTDLFAVGAVLFELLDGRRFRWHCADEDALFQEIYRERVPSLRRKDVPAAVVAVLRGLLQPRREHRIATADKALARLERWDGFATGPAALVSLIERSAESRRPIELPVPPTIPPSRRGAGGLASRPRRPWDEARPAWSSPTGGSGSAPTERAHGDAEPASVIPRASTGSSERLLGRSRSAPESSVIPSRRDPSQPRRTRGSASAPSVPAWASSGDVRATDEVTEEEPSASELATKVVTAAPLPSRAMFDPVERAATRSHPVVRREEDVEADVPVARRAAEIAVTKPQPSRRAPWAKEAGSYEHRVTRPEPGTPILRHRSTSRSSSSGNYRHDRTGSVAPRARESASMHHVADDSAPIAGEIVSDDAPPDMLIASPWIIGSR